MSRRRSFAEVFGRTPQWRTDAPGRVNLIGEHTDYNGGFVLPAAIPQRTRVELALREDRLVRVWSAETGEEAPAAFTLSDERRTGDWLDYVQGVTFALAATGRHLGGFEARIESEVPLGSGLSSSAALEVSLLRALREALSLELSDVELALVGHRAEVDFVGAPVGVMDQMASSLADESAALFLDAHTLEWRRVPIPEDAELAVISSGIAHRLATGDYRTRRAECERAAGLLGVALLRELDESALPAIAKLPPPLDRRARHVITENARVLEAVRAMEAGDLVRLGTLLDASHASLRDDFEVSIPEIDLLVELAGAEPGVLGARLTGGGFGGSIVVLCRRGAAARVAAAAVRAYIARTGESGRALVPVSP